MHSASESHAPLRWQRGWRAGTELPGTRALAAAVAWLAGILVLVALLPDHGELAGQLALLALPGFVATGWAVRWWQAAVLAAAVSIGSALQHPPLLDLVVTTGAGPATDAALGTFAIALLLCGLGRAGQYAWHQAARRRSAEHGHRAEREARQRTALAFQAAAHEVGNALTPLAAHVETLEHRLLAQAPGPALDVRLADPLAQIHRTLARLERLVDDFRGLGQGGDAAMRIQAKPVDLAPTLRALARERGPRFAAQGLTWSVQVPQQLPCTADVDRVSQAVLNLCQNALRYTPPGGAVQLRAWSHEGVPVIEVRDTGIGVRHEDAGRLFAPFVRLDPDVRDGSGLGLWVVRRIAQAHGGDADVVSPGFGQGACFRFWLGAAGRVPEEPDLAVDAVLAR